VEALRLIGRGYLTFAWRYPELYRVMYGLDGVTFSISEPEKEGLRIDEVVTATVKDVLESHNWSTEHLAEHVNILWSTAHGLVTLTMADRIPGGQAQAMQLLERTFKDMLLAWEHNVDAPLPESPSGDIAAL
jgi:hypothetical protein